MGEIADPLIEGDSLCASCGVYLEWADAPGFPLYCSRQCAPTPEEVDTPREVLYKSTGHLFTDILEQKWTNALGDEEWRPIPIADSEEIK